MTSKINHNLEIGEDGTEYTLKLNGQEITPVSSDLNVAYTSLTVSGETQLNGATTIGESENESLTLTVNGGSSFVGGAKFVSAEIGLRDSVELNLKVNGAIQATRASCVSVDAGTASFGSVSTASVDCGSICGVSWSSLMSRIAALEALAGITPPS
jgi:hypothetical protein